MHTLLFSILLALSPVAFAEQLPVETDFAKFTLPSGWSTLTTQARNVRKPIIYLRQKYKVTSIGSDAVSTYLYVQDIPSFRGKELPLSEIDAAFERVSQLSGDTETLGDYYIPNITELKSSTGTLLGRPSREFSYWTEPTDTKYFFRLSYASFGGKLYGVEMASLKQNTENDAAWRLLIDTLRSTAKDASSTSSRGSSSSSSSSKPTVDLGARAANA